MYKERMKKLSESLTDKPVYLCLYGSQNYECDLQTPDYSSDFDYKAIVIPTLKQLVFNSKPKSVTVDTLDGQVDMKDIRVFFDTLMKCNPAFVECMMTEHWIGDKDFEVARELMPQFVWEMREQFIKACYGMMMEKKKALQHPYPSVVERLQKFGYDCYDKETLFLTRHGWKKYDDILDNEEVGTMNPTTHTLEFQLPISRIKKMPTSQMYDVETYDTHFRITENHNVFMSNVKNINFNGHKYKHELANWKLYPLKEAMNSNYHKHLYSFPKNNNEEYDISDEKLMLLGAYISEGSINFSNKEQTKVKSIRIYQTKNGKQEFYEMMNSLPFNLNFYHSNTRGKEESVWVGGVEIAHEFFQLCGHGSHTKHLPQWFYLLSERQSKILLHSLMLGDGSFREQRSIYYTCNYQLATEVLTLALMSGKHATLMGGEKGYFGKGNFGDSNMFHISVKEKELNPSYVFCKDGKNVSLIENYTDEVVCFEVPNGLLVTMYNGKTAVQGNCKQLHHMVRLFQMMKDFESSDEVVLVPESKEYLKDIKLGKCSLNNALELSELVAKKGLLLKNKLLDEYARQEHTYHAVNKMKQFGLEYLEKKVREEVLSNG